jgi:DNA-binding response OmpR family regulator
MEEMALARPRCVLIVDQAEETREVLKTALERRGMRVLAAAGAGEGLELARFHRPELVVLDVESHGRGAEGAHARFARELVDVDRATRLLLLGKCRLPDRSRGAEFVRKPYHYGPLIRRIEELLGVAEPRLARCA